MATDPMTQTAPFPYTLSELVAKLEYRDGWTFRLVDNLDRGQGSEGLTLVIAAATVNSYPPHEPMTVHHYMPVPPAAYDMRSWRRWLLDQVLLVERHEACEFFTLVTRGDFIRSDGERVSEYRDKPYAPSHGPGNDPYLVREVGTDEDRRTSFRGVLAGKVAS